jgi:hypothetical protein
MCARQGLRLVLLALLSLHPACAMAATYASSSTAYDFLNGGETEIKTWASGLGCPDTIGDDSLSNLINIGFTFRFGTSTYTQVRVNSNGRIQFANTLCPFGTQSVGPPRTYPTPMPSAFNDRTITGYRVDLDVSLGGKITYANYGTAPNRIFAVTWQDVPQWNAKGSRYRFQIQLHEDGTFKLMYASADDFISGTKTSIGPGEYGYQLATGDFIAGKGFPAAKSGLLFGPPSATTRFLISHATHGIYCLDQAVTLTAVDAGGSKVTSYGGTVKLDTGTGKGSWGVASGAGKLDDGTPDDGIATYVWPKGEASATFALSYRAGPATVTIHANDVDVSSMTDDDKHGSIAFTPNGFTVTSAALASPHPSTIPAFGSPQVAGSNVPVHITAFGQTPTDATCGVITTYTGARNLNFWATRVNPATGSIAPTINGSAIAKTEVNAAAQSVTFSSGRASVTLKYKDVGSLAIAMKDTTTGSTLLPTGIRGASETFVMRPSDLVVTSVTTPAGAANPAAASATGAAFLAAGAPFTAVVQARDAEGSVTPNFGLETPAEGVRLAATLVLPAGGRNGTANDGTIGNASAATRTAAGTFTGTSFRWDEVGIVRLRASIADGNYLGAGAFTGTASGNVGRFIPSALALVGAPVVTPPCTGFAYMGQDVIRVAFTLEARNAQGTRTQNFDTVLLGIAGTGAPSLVAENANAGVDLAGRIRNFSAIWTAGQAVVDDLDVGVMRNATPDGPFATFALGVKQQGDPDGLLIAGADMAAASAGNCATAATCDARSLGTLAVYFGRAVLHPGIAAETSPLDMRVSAQRWNGSAFVANTADACTTVAAASATLGNFSGNLGMGETLPVAPASPSLLSSGTTATSRHLRLSAPGTGNDGKVRVTLDLPDWLTWDWQGDGVLRDPWATATFGQYRGHDRIVFRREVR